MSDLNMQLAREFFELNFFYVLPHWRFETAGQDMDTSASLLFVEQSGAAQAGDPGLLLHPGDVKHIQRAVVEVRAWHADRLYPSVIEANPVFARVASEPTRTLAENVFSGRDYKIILIVSEFSTAPARRDQALRRLAEMGIDHVVEFPTILADLLRLISAQDSYAPSQTLQTIRLLKRYGFIRRQQLELFFPAPTPDASDAMQGDMETEFVEVPTEETEDTEDV